VSAVAYDFTNQPGVPLISVASGPTGVTLTQGRFASDAASKASLTWRTPVLLLSLNDGVASEELVAAGKPRKVAGPVVVNAGWSGYYRVAYDEAALAPLAAGLGRLLAPDQFGLLKDSYALGMAGDAPIGNFMRLAASLPVDADPLVWREVANTLASVDSYYTPGPQRAAYRTWASGVLGPVLARIGFDARAKEPDNDAVLRERLLLALSQIGDPKVIAEAGRRFQDARSDLTKLSAGERRWVLAGRARTADAATFQDLHDLARGARDPLEKEALYNSLTAVEDPVLAAQVLALAITD